MKKSLTIISTAILALTLAACSEKESKKTDTSGTPEILNSVKYEDKSLNKIDFHQITDRKKHSSTVIKRGEFSFNINIKSMPAEEALQKTGADMIKVTKHEDNGKIDYVINVDISESMPLKAVITSQKLILHPLSVKENISKKEVQSLVDAFSKHYQAYHDAYIAVEQGEANAETGMTQEAIKAAYDKVPFQNLNIPYNYEEEDHFYVYEFNTPNLNQFAREISMKTSKGGYEIVLVSDAFNPENGKKVGVSKQKNDTPLIQIQMLEILTPEQTKNMIDELNSLHIASAKTGIYTPEAVLEILQKYKAEPIVPPTVENIVENSVSPKESSTVTEAPAQAK